MGKRSGFPELSEADEMSQKQIKQEIDRLKFFVDFVASGSAKHKATRKLASWERHFERRFSEMAPTRPNRSGKT